MFCLIGKNHWLLKFQDSKQSLILNSFSINIIETYVNEYRMTVFEHFTFYGKLRGRSHEKVTEEAEEMVKSLGLWEKRNALSSSLSGGMKRKLSVATAFVGT